MTVDIGVLIIGSSAPSGNINSDADMDDWIWLNPVNGEMYKFNQSTGLYDIYIPVPTHNHIGYSGTVKIGSKDMTILNGLVTAIE